MVEWWKKNKPNLTEIPPKLSSASPRKPGTVPSSTLPGRRQPDETPPDREETPFWTAGSKPGEGKTPVPPSENASIPGSSTLQAGPTVSVQGGKENDPYGSIVQRKISGNWRPPMVEGSENGFALEVVFDIERNGSVGEVRIEKSSGNDFFDQAALRAIYQARPFPPFLPGTPEGRILFRVRFGVGELS
jgi:TonB family protein